MPTRMDIFDDEPTEEAPVVDTDMTLIADGLSTCRLGASDSEPEPDKQHASPTGQDLQRVPAARLAAVAAAVQLRSTSASMGSCCSVRSFVRRR